MSPEAVAARLERLASDPLLFGLAVFVLYLVRPLLAWPPTACAVAVGYGYGVYGIPLALAGAAFTALGPFYATRWTLGAGSDPGAGDGTGAANVDGSPDGIGGWITVSAGEAREAGERYFKAAGDVRGMTAARLAPIPADVTTCGAAACGVSVGTMVVGTLVGEIPWTVAAVLVGASAGKVVGGIGEVGLPLTVATAIGAALLLAGPAYRHLRDAGGEGTPG